MEALWTQVRHNLDQLRVISASAHEKMGCSNLRLSHLQPDSLAAQRDISVLIWDKFAERCRQRGRKSRSNYVIRQGGDRVEEGIRILVSATVRLRQVWLQHRYCLSPHVWRRPQLWVPEETCSYLEGDDRPPKTWSFTRLNTHHLRGSNARMW